MSLARSLSSAQGLDDTLEAITSGAVHTIPGADFAGVTLVRNKTEVQSVAATDELAEQADRLQGDLQEGPCLSALWEHDTYQVDDLSAEERWPKFRDGALELGVRSILSFQLFIDERNLGALNLYSREADAFAGNDASQVGLLFATYASVALRGAQKERELTVAVDNRDVIGMGKGILMERYKVDANKAFGMLVRASQTGHVKLHEVAGFLVRQVESGESVASGD